MRGAGLGLAALATLAVLAISPLAAGKPAERPPHRAQVRGSEYDLVLSKPKLRPGRVIIQFLNAGEDSHDLRLQRRGEGAEFGFGSVEPGGYENLDARLRKGSTYILWCSLSDHRQRGMEATLRTRRHRHRA